MRTSGRLTTGAAVLIMTISGMGAPSLTGAAAGSGGTGFTGSHGRQRFAVGEIVVAAYPDRLGGPAPVAPAVHPLVRELGRILGEDSPIPAGDRAVRSSVVARAVFSCGIPPPVATAPVSSG